MDETTSRRDQDLTGSADTPHDRTSTTLPATPADRLLERRRALRSRHSQGLTRLMEERSDLRGVHALADFVDDAVRWTA